MFNVMFNVILKSFKKILFTKLVNGICILNQDI